MFCHVQGSIISLLGISDIMNKMEKSNEHLEFAQVIQMGDDTKMFLIEPLL